MRPKRRAFDCNAAAFCVDVSARRRSRQGPPRSPQTRFAGALILLREIRRGHESCARAPRREGHARLPRSAERRLVSTMPRRPPKSLGGPLGPPFRRSLAKGTRARQPGIEGRARRPPPRVRRIRPKERRRLATPEYGMRRPDRAQRSRGLPCDRAKSASDRTLRPARRWPFRGRTAQRVDRAR
jgi:hypothetical protein